eukprot:4449472-Prymnesium_polylepis.1
MANRFPDIAVQGLRAGGSGRGTHLQVALAGAHLAAVAADEGLPGAPKVRRVEKKYDRLDAPRRQVERPQQRLARGEAVGVDLDERADRRPVHVNRANRLPRQAGRPL